MLHIPLIGYKKEAPPPEPRREVTRNRSVERPPVRVKETARPRDVRSRSKSRERRPSNKVRVVIEKDPELLGARHDRIDS